MIEYTVKRNEKREKLAAKIIRGKLIVYAPKRTGLKEIERFVKANEALLAAGIEDYNNRPHESVLTEEETERLKAMACSYIPARTAEIAAKYGFKYNKISIRFQTTKWGSCTSAGNLSFNAMLMLTPYEVIDAIIVHELCHLKHMNHGKDFYREVRSVCPSYDKCNKWLNDNGKRIMERNPNLTDE